MDETQTFPATPEEYEEYREMMDLVAEEAIANTPDMLPRP